MQQCAVALFAVLGLAAGAVAENVKLPEPEKTGGMPLMEAVATRSTRRRTAGEAPTPQQRSNLLWAANGITRPDGKRPAPSAMDKREIEIAVLTKDGLFPWDPEANELIETPACVELDDQLRGASALLIYHYNKAMQSRDAALADCGLVGQSVCLFCASEGWKTVFRGTVDRAKFAVALGRGEDEILFARRIGGE